MHNMLSLPHLPRRDTIGKESLVDYFQLQVVTYNEY